MKQLRDYQHKAIELVRDEMRSGKRWVVVVQGTGSGKTVVGTEFVRLHLEKNPNAKVLWIAHRTELIGQAWDTIDAELPDKAAVIQSNACRITNPYRPIQVASIQTVIAQKKYLFDVTLVVADECHHVGGQTWGEYFSFYKREGAFGIGLTATPQRGDGLPLGDMFDALVHPIHMKELIEREYLVDYDLHRPPRKLHKNELAQDPYDAWKEHADGKKTIVFASNLTNASLFVDSFKLHGVSVGMITGSMPFGERRQVLNDLASGRITVCVNCSVLTEGFDDPTVECVILARNVGTVGLYLQIVGRSLRTSPGKEKAVIIDLFGSSYQHGEPAEEREYSLEGQGIRRKGEAVRNPFRQCRVCGITIEDFDPEDPTCPSCGVATGTLPPEYLNIKLVKYARARKQGSDKRSANLRKWLQEAYDKSWKVGQVFFKYSAVYGEKPPKEILDAADYPTFLEMFKRRAAETPP